MADEKKTITLEEIRAKEDSIGLKAKTLHGYTLEEAFDLLDTQLPKEAYKKIEGGVGAKLGLTDIKPAFTNDLLNRIFGLAGIGWGVRLDAAPRITVGKTSGNNPNWFADVSGEVWIAYTLDGKTIERAPLGLASVGGHENAGRPEWAQKGAVTNLIGNAFSLAGMQRSVYKDERDDQTVSAAEADAEREREQAIADVEQKKLDTAQTELLALIDLAKIKGKTDEVKAWMEAHSVRANAVSFMTLSPSEKKELEALVKAAPEPEPEAEAPASPPVYEDDIPF